MALGQHVAVERFQGGKGGFEEAEVFDGTAPGQAGEDVIGAEEQVLIHQPCQQGFEIVAPALQFDVVALGDVVDAHVKLTAARQRTGDLFAEEEIGAGTQSFHGVDGIVIGDCHQIHAEPLELFVDFERLVVAFTAHWRMRGMVHMPECLRMDVQIAPHIRVVTCARSHSGDSAKKHS